MSSTDKKSGRARCGTSPSMCLSDGREMVGMIQTNGICRVTITAAPVLMSHNLPEGADHRELHLELREDGSKVKRTNLSRGQAEALIGLLRAGVETL